MTGTDMKIVRSSYDAYGKNANISVICGKTHLNLTGLPAPDYPDSEKEQQARIRKEAAELLRKAADFLDAE